MFILYVKQEFLGPVNEFRNCKQESEVSIIKKSKKYENQKTAPAGEVFIFNITFFINIYLFIYQFID